MASTKTAGPDGAAFRNDADAVALSLVACVAAGRARGAKAGKALQKSPLPSGVLCPAFAPRQSLYSSHQDKLYSSHQDKNDYEDQNDAEPTAGIIAPAA